MVPCIFNLSELKEFGQVLEMKDQSVFVKKFADCLKGLLLSQSLWPLDSNLSSDCSLDGVSVFANPPKPVDLEFDFALLKETMYFEPDYNLLKTISAELALMENCRARIERFNKNGWWYRLKHCRYRRFLSQYRKRLNRELKFQDIFSAATAYFVQQRWGNGADLKRQLVY